MVSVSSMLALMLALTLTQAFRPSPANSFRVPRNSARLNSFASHLSASRFSELISAITAEDLAGYQKEGVPPWVVLLSVSLVALTASVPIIVRKRQVERNTRRPSQDTFSELEKVQDE